MEERFRAGFERASRLLAYFGYVRNGIHPCKIIHSKHRSENGELGGPHVNGPGLHREPTIFVFTKLTGVADELGT